MTTQSAEAGDYLRPGRRIDCCRRWEMNSNTIGSIDTADDADRHQREVVLDDRDVAEQQARAEAQAHPQDRADDVVEDEGLSLVISAAPATNGTNVRTIGTNRPRMTALPPYFSKNSCARFRWSRFSSRCEIAVVSSAANTRGPMYRPIE